MRQKGRLNSMKKILRSVVCAACILTIIFSLTSCSAEITVIEANENQLNPDKLMRGEQIAHLVYLTSLSSGETDSLAYESNYTLTRETVDGQDIIRILNQAASGNQTMETESVLLAQNTDNATCLMPLSVRLTYEDQGKVTDNTYVSAIHDHLVRSQTIEIQQYADENSSELETTNYMVNTAEPVSYTHLWGFSYL